MRWVLFGEGEAVYHDILSSAMARVSGRRRISESLFVTIPPVRPVKLDFFDYPFTCPLCKEQIVYTWMHTVIVSSRRSAHPARESC